jgi:hypothetical protein
VRLNSGLTGLSGWALSSLMRLNSGLTGLSGLGLYGSYVRCSFGLAFFSDWGDCR